MEKNYCFVTEAFGHGFGANKYAQAMGLTPVAAGKDADLIKKNFSFIPNLQSAEDMMEGVDFRQMLIAGDISFDEWYMFAAEPMHVILPNDIPQFASLKEEDNNVLITPAKLISDGQCGTDAKGQSLYPELFKFVLEDETARPLLGQHFDKVNDLPKVDHFKEVFQSAPKGVYVPGEYEDQSVFGMRKISHVAFWNFYRKVKKSVGIAGTHTWYMLTCFPHIGQVILTPKQGLENWELIAEAYRSRGRKVYVIRWDEEMDKKELEKEIRAAYAKL